VEEKKVLEAKNPDSGSTYVLMGVAALAIAGLAFWKLSK